jgi:predicted lysophospholipase L1 biosynthesis ABC-type transport system permease subunit
LAVAARIKDSTGLEVDIVKGASTRVQSVAIPAGRFGRPALRLDEDWWQKGTALKFTRALRTQDVALTSLVLLGALILVGESAFVSVRRRWPDFGVLRSLGWPAARIAWLVEIELLLLGSLAGVVTLGVALIMRATLLPAIPRWLLPTALLLPALVAAVAGVIPALTAARGSAIQVVRGRGQIRRSRPPHSPVTMALRDLVGIRRLETSLGVFSVVLAAAMVGGIVLATKAFAGRLDVTALGQFLGGRVRPQHVIIAALALGFGGLAAGEIVTLGYLERQQELAALRALGWPRRRVLSMLAAQGVAMGLAGGVIGGALVLVGGLVSGEILGPALVGALTGAVVAPLATSLAVAGPLFMAYRATPASILRGE